MRQPKTIRERRHAVAWLYTLSRRAVRLARRYRERGPNDGALLACLDAIRGHRARIRQLRLGGA